MKIVQALLMILTLLIVPYAVHAGISVQNIEVKHFLNGTQKMTAVKVTYKYSYDANLDSRTFGDGYGSTYDSTQLYYGLNLQNTSGSAPRLTCSEQSTVGIGSSPFSGVRTQRCITHTGKATRDTIIRQYINSSPSPIQIVTTGYLTGNVCVLAAASAPNVYVYLTGDTFSCVAAPSITPKCNIIDPIVLDHGTVTFPGTGALTVDKTVSLSCDKDASVTISDNSGTANKLQLGQGVISTVTLNNSAFPVKLSAKADQAVSLKFKSSLSIDSSVQAGNYEKSIVLTINYE